MRWRIFPPNQGMPDEGLEPPDETGNKILRRPVGRWALPYLYRIIADERYSTALQQLLARVDLAQGVLFVYAPAGVPADRLRLLEFGGVVPVKWISPYEAQLSDIPQKKLIRYLWRWLNGRDKPSDVFSSASQRFLLGEDCMWSPEDGYFPEEPPHFLVHMGRLYAWTTAHDGYESLEALVYDLDRAYPHLLLCGIGAYGPVLDGDYVRSVLSESEQEYQVPLIVFGAYDAESYLVWRMRRQER